MSTIDLGMVLNGVGRHPAGALGSADAPLRVVLVQGEALRLPRSRTHIRVLSGLAWVTQDGQDRLLGPGQGMTARADADCAVVSALGTQPLLVEVR